MIVREGRFVVMKCDLCPPTRDGPARTDCTEDELLAFALALGWQELEGLHVCPAPWHTIQDCVVCGAVAMNGAGKWYCDEHWPYKAKRD